MVCDEGLELSFRETAIRNAENAGRIFDVMDN